MLGHDSRSLALLLDAEQSLSTAHAVDVALAVCAAVRPLHDRGTVHGALSVHALSLARGPEGIRDVHVLGADAARALVDSEQILRAPEQLDDRRPDARTDVWGVGVLLYTMLAGAPPFVADSPSAINLSLVLDDAPSLAGVPDALAEIVDACLSKNPALRPANLSVLENKLRPFASSVPGAPESTARREVIAAAMLRDASSLEIVVDVEPSVRDVAAPPPRAERPATLRPIARTLPPEPARGTRLWHVTGAGLAAACLLVAVGVGFGSRGANVATAPPSGRHAAVEAPVSQPPPPAPESSPARPTEVETAVPASALPAAAAVVPTSHPRARPLAAKSRPGPSERAARNEKVNPAAAATETAPPTTEAHAEPKPETKAADDDLRHYLDDRR
jgi:serine/threonine-protein kinase